MLLNNQHIRGMFLYAEDIEFERGDFVISGNSIYLCTAENPNTDNFTVLNSNPATDSTNFTIYLGDKITSADEYFNFVNDPAGKVDKYMSSHSVSEILNHYMMGFDEKGVINNFVEVTNSELNFSDSLTGILIGSTVTNVLDKIIQAEDINNAVFRISREILANYLPTIDNISGVADLDKNSVILRQYSYINTNNSLNTKYRLQEVIDPINSITMYRYSSGNTVSKWKCSSVNLDFRNEVEYVKQKYISELEKLDVYKQELREQFAFRSTEITKTNQVELQCTDSSQLGYINVNNFDDPTVVTLVIQEPYQNNIFKNYSITIDLSDIIGPEKINSYYISEDCTLIGDPASSSTNIKLSLTSKGRFNNIYYRQSYE